MKILLAPNFEKQNSAACTNEAIRILHRLGATPLLDAQSSKYLLEENLSFCQLGSFSQLLPSADVLVSIGGDGTILHTVKSALLFDKPVLGINTGRVGFLTQLEPHELEHLSTLVAGEFWVQNRMLLDVQVKNHKQKSYLALNDVVVRRCDCDSMADICIHANGEPIASYRADGVIFSTPTGSTAYSLSAGGPIVDPDIEAVIMTAICPHSASNRSLILSAQNTYTLCRTSVAGSENLHVTVDGNNVEVLSGTDSIEVRRSTTFAKFIQLGKKSFYSVFNEKFTWRG